MINLNDIKLIKFPRHGGLGHELRVFQVEMGAVPFPIMRVFTIQAGNGERRGKHAHKSCSQLMVCLLGCCKVACSDGEMSKPFMLDPSSGGLLVPPGIWAEQTYLDSPSLLMVLCDRLYEEDDYLRDYQVYLAFRKSHAK